VKHLLVALGALLAAGSASACSCEFQDDAGFIHAKLQRLPANARGALFQLPYGSSIKLDAAAFTIVSDRQPQPLKAEISWPTLGIAVPDLLAERMLARVGPVGGFTPGAHYTITYTGAAYHWRHPLRTAFTIDTAALKVGTYQLVAAGAPARRLLALPGMGGACSSNQAAVVADFNYRIPDHYAPYRQAMIYASEARGADGASRLVAYTTSSCRPWSLDAVTHSDGSDLINASCEQPGPPVDVRGHAGLLEVEDRLQITNDLRIDFRQAAGQACTGSGMLDEAIAQADTRRINEVVCAIGKEQWYLGEGPRHALPALTTLLKLALRPDRPPRACIDEATLRWKDQLAWTLDPVLAPVQQGLRPLTHAMNLVAEALVDALTPSPLSHQQK
jgi:hypothetical protein